MILRELMGHTVGEEIFRRGQNKGADDRRIGASKKNLKSRAYFFIPSTASFAAFATRNFTTVLAGI